MSDTKEKRLPNMPVKVIGPQLGLPNQEKAIVITIGLPHMIALDTLNCILLTEEGQAIDSQPAGCVDDRFRNFVFLFDNLVPNQKYFYVFRDKDGIEIALEGGLSYQDCYFIGPIFNNEKHKFVLLSCNNPFESGHEDQLEQFRMWKRLNDRIRNDDEVHLIIQGGDQVYHDRIEHIANGLKGDEASIESTHAVIDEIIKNYQDYYSNLDYRQIMARIPSVAMLDDHDITDGWGGRPESYAEGSDYKKEWSRYFELTYGAFKAYQAIKNPAPITKSAATTYLDLGDNRLYLLDLRAEKNIKTERPLISVQHEEDLFRSLDNIPASIKNVFILCPVVPCRINRDAEKILTIGAQVLIAIRSVLEEKDDFKGKALILSLIKNSYLVNLYDDLTDSLSSDENIPFLRKLLAIGHKNLEQGKKFVLLSGDIHTGGLSEIFIKKGEQSYVVPQIVSSPIGYKPMPKIFKDKTTDEKEIDYSGEDEFKIVGRNIFYRSDRNFVIITPAKLKDPEGVSFYFECLSHPISCSAYFSS